MTSGDEGAPQISEEEIGVVCPRCFANPWEPCVTPSGDFAAATHVSRARKAESIANDLATLGYLPELGPETEHASAAPTRPDPDQPAEDEPMTPEPAVQRGREASR